MTAKTIKIFNTASRNIELFEPIKNGFVSIYSCGPTVYSHPHLGNMRAFVFADILRRAMEMSGYSVNHVMNITDVGHLTDDGDNGEDKMLVGMRAEGLSALEISRKYTELFISDVRKLNVKEVSTLCRATEHIREQIELIQKIETKGATYTTPDGVYFDTSKFPSYGKMARLDIDGLRGGERVSIGAKRHKTDFALWKFAPENSVRDMQWESPWGVGFPGWHIECSAMAMKYLGETIDIHTGGIDHIPVHHTNEIAQSECATGSCFARYWMHSEFLSFIGEEKMSKSKGNVVTVNDLEASGIDPLAFRYLILQAHYRSHMQYSREIMQAGATAYRRLKQHVISIKKEVDDSFVNFSEKYYSYKVEIERNISEDLNTAAAIAVLRQALGDTALNAAEKYKLACDSDKVLGLALDKEAEKVDVPVEVTRLVAEREKARADLDWSAADRIRYAIEDLGYSLKDTPEGPIVGQ